jgi:phosphotriesterase-related protein
VPDLVIRTLERDILPAGLGRTLAHEHVYSDFAGTSGDPDLAFIDEAAIGRELAVARVDGVDAVVEMSTYDMEGSPARVAAMCSAAGLVAVKSTGWFRSPFLDGHVEGQDADALADRLIEDVERGFSRSSLRAGLIGEVGIRTDSPTATERVALDAVATAAIETGVGIAAHTDDWPNACCIVEQLTDRGVSPHRLMVAHARHADPLAGQRELLRAGVTLAFDQLGHPKREPVALVADRISQLVEEGFGAHIAISSDVGRISRLSGHGGSGYVGGLRSLLRELESRSLDKGDISSLTRTAIAAFLAFVPRPAA